MFHHHVRQLIWSFGCLPSATPGKIDSSPQRQIELLLNWALNDLPLARQREQLSGIFWTVISGGKRHSLADFSLNDPRNNYEQEVPYKTVAVSPWGGGKSPVFLEKGKKYSVIYHSKERSPSTLRYFGDGTNNPAFWANMENIPKRNSSVKH